MDNRTLLNLLGMERMIARSAEHARCQTPDERAAVARRHEAEARAAQRAQHSPGKPLSR